MLKFGKLKIEIAVSIKLSILITITNTISMTSNYWFKHTDKNTNTKLLTGLWYTCNSTTGKCSQNAGIVHNTITLWSIFVHSLIILGTVLNIGSMIMLILIFTLKFFKNIRVKLLLILLEIVNGLLLFAFISLIIGFCILLSSNCTYSIWLQAVAISCAIISSNLLTRVFAKLYYNTV